ncbi:MAG: polysaccharide pyruvyl transferase family protein [Candidatus Micrarchaeia archaeon]|jgi:polysaccharide pyruvyl transferase WcaK-like protein
MVSLHNNPFTVFRNSKKIMIIGSYGQINLGDEMILTSFYQNIKVLNPSAKIVVPVRIPKNVRKIHGSEAVTITGIFNPLTLLGNFLSCDTIVVGGGGMFSKYTGFFARFSPFVLLVGKLFGKKAGYFGIGFYTTAPKFEKSLINFSCNFCDFIILRDKSSLCVLNDKMQKKAEVVDDLSFYVTSDKRLLVNSALELFSKKVGNARKKQKKKVVGISIKPLKSTAETAALIDKMAKLISSTPAFYVFYPFAVSEVSARSDLPLIQSMITKSGIKEDSYLVMDQTHPIVWRESFKKLDFVIGMRYHSILFAHQMKVPLYGISYEIKCDEFLKEHDLNGASYKNLDVAKMQKEISGANGK